MWQKCPICNGSGHTENTYIGLTGDLNKSNGICTTCNGMKIISEVTGLPPVKPKTDRQQEILDKYKVPVKPLWSPPDSSGTPHIQPEGSTCETVYGPSKKDWTMEAAELKWNNMIKDVLCKEWKLTPEQWYDLLSPKEKAEIKDENDEIQGSAFTVETNYDNYKNPIPPKKEGYDIADVDMKIYFKGEDGKLNVFGDFKNRKEYETEVIRINTISDQLKNKQ